MLKAIKRSFIVTAATVTLVGGLLFSGNVTEAAFRDVQSGSFYEEPVTFLVDKGVINGYEDNTFRPNNSVTRAEISTMLANVLGLRGGSASRQFSDVALSAWYAEPINSLAASGIVNGFEDGTFRPNGNVTRAEMAIMIVNAYDEVEVKQGATTSFTDVKAGVWYTDSIAALVAAGITQGKSPTSFAPNQPVTRAEAATFIYRAEKLKAESGLEVIDIR